MGKNKPFKKFWGIKASADGESADVFILGEIATSGWEYSASDTSSFTFHQDLADVGDVKTINVHLDSPGGDVFSGVAIMNMLKQNKAQVYVYVDGLAASTASVIAMAGDKVFMPSNAMMMIHNPWTVGVGNAADLRKQADDLDHVSQSMKQSYLDKAGDKLDEQTLTSLMDNETWLSAQEAVDYGLADDVLAPVNAAACLTDKFVSLYKHAPKNLLRSQSEKPAAPAGGGDPAVSAGPTPQQSSLLEEKLKILRGE